MFYFSNAINSSVYVIILASALRLDFANCTVMLNCAVFFIYNVLMFNIIGLLVKLQRFSIVIVKVNNAELQLW